MFKIRSIIVKIDLKNNLIFYQLLTKSIIKKWKYKVYFKAKCLRTLVSYFIYNSSIKYFYSYIISVL